jgi:hypothetical protein
MLLAMFAIKKGMHVSSSGREGSQSVEEKMEADQV